MTDDWFRLREGSSKDLPALAQVDGSFSNEWVLYLQRRGGPIEQTIELRWRKVRPAGSRRGSLPSTSKEFEEERDELRTELRRSGRLPMTARPRN